MRMRHLVLLILVVSLIPAQLFAQTTFPTVYVSTGAAKQILAIDGGTAAITGLCTLTGSTAPEDVVIGPDGNLYVGDPLGNQIFRVATPIPAPPAVAPASSCVASVIYSKGTSTCKASNGTMSVAVCPAGPEGPSFLRINTLDLYFNTGGHGTTNAGIWSIADIAGANATCSVPNNTCPGPVQIINPLGASGEGVDFDINGNLLAVAGNQVFRGIAPGFTCISGNTITPNCATPFISTNLSSPFGVALNTCGDVLVASGKNVNRYSSTTGAFLDSLTFTGNNLPKFLEADSADRLYLVTAQNESGQGGTVYRFDPPDINNLNSCALAKSGKIAGFSQGFSLSLKAGLVPGLTTGNAVGLGISATNVQTLTQTFSDSTPHLFSFGAQHSLSITCNNVVTPFQLQVTALKSRPSDAANAEVFFSSPFPSSTTQQCPTQIVNPVSVHDGSEHGFSTQYKEQAFDAAGNPLTDAEFVSGGYCTASASSPYPFRFKIGLFSPEFISAPGGAHHDDTTRTYGECQSQDFYTTAGPGLDSGFGLGGGNSEHVAFNSGLRFNGAITLNSPISSCTTQNGVVNCNPQFNIGQNINVKFTLLESTAPFAPITTATEQLSILLVQYTLPGQQPVTGLMVPQPVVATKNSATLNFFVPNSSGQYSYNDDSSFLTAGIPSPTPKGTLAVYQFTIWGNGAPPFSFLVTGTF